MIISRLRNGPKEIIYLKGVGVYFTWLSAQYKFYILSLAHTNYYIFITPHDCKQSEKRSLRNNIFETAFKHFFTF